MKFLDTFERFAPSPRFLGKENGDHQQVSLNTSVIDKFKTEQTEADDQTRLNQAERLALNEMPEFGRDIIEEIAKSDLTGEEKFFGERSIKKLKKSVTKKVFETLDGVGRNSLNSSGETWGARYQETVMAIKEEKVNDEITLENVLRAENVLESLQEKYERMADVVSRSKEAKKEKYDHYKLWKHRWVAFGLGGYRREEKDNSERDIFNTRNKAVMEAFEKIKKQVEDRKADAEYYVERTAKTLETGFESLSPDEKTAFLTDVEAEIAGTPIPARGPSGDVINGTLPHHRLEAYKRLSFGQEKQKKILEKGEIDDQASRDELKERRDFVEKLHPAFDRIKKEFKLKNNKSENVPEIGDLMTKIKDHVSNHDSTFHPRILGSVPPNITLNDHEEFLAYCQFLGQGNGSLLNSMSAELQREFLAYIDQVEEMERPDEEGFSSEFIKAEEEIEKVYSFLEGNFTTFRSYTDIVAVKVAWTGANPIPNEIADRQKEIATQRANLNAILGSLPENERKILEDLVAQLEVVSGKLKELETKWEQEIKAKADYDTKKAAWDLNKTSVDTAVSTLEALRGTLGGPKKESANEAKITAAIQARQNVLDKEPPIPTFTTISQYSDSWDIITTKSQEIVKRDSGNNKASDWRQRRRTLYFREQAAKANNEAFLRRFRERQNTQFETLLTLHEGTDINIDMEPMQHGKALSSLAVLNHAVTPKALKILDKTADAVIAFAGNELYVIQKSGNGGIHILEFNAPRGYTGANHLDPNIQFAETPNKVSELMSVTL